MPLRVGLRYTQMKLGRAYEHLNELKNAVTAYRENAYIITRQDNPKKPVHHVAIDQNITPDAIGVLPGEFAYNLRSGLDHLAWQLALLTCDAPNDKTCFPIFGKSPGTKSRYWEAVRDIPPKAAAIIDELQPYHRGAGFEEDPLWQLNRLCNIDKHQVVAVSFTHFQVGVYGVSKCWRKDLNHAIVITVPLAEKDQLDLRVEVPAVVFGEPIDTTDASSDFEITLERFGEIYDFIRHNVVPRFAVFFPE